MAPLPIFSYDSNLHFIKAPTCKQEIRHLLHLGRTEGADLVFPKYPTILAMLPLGIPTAHESWNIRNWMLEIIDGVSFLHSLGVVHRDLDLRTILAGDPVVICDLQCLDSMPPVTAVPQTLMVEIGPFLYYE